MKSSLKTVIGYTPSFDLENPFHPLDYRASEPSHSFAQHIHDLNAEIRRPIALSNESDKLAANAHCRSPESQGLCLGSRSP